MNLSEDISLTGEYTKALEMMQNDMYRCVFVTGKAGTGKSTLLKHYIKNYAPKGNTVVLAPTGVAAVNIGGQTIHSFFGFPLRILLEDDDEIKRLSKEYPKAQLLRNIKVIVIDEISMVRADLIDAMDTYLRINTGSYAPFGGIKMIFFGDLFQLAPVVEEKKSEQQALLEDFKRRYPSPFFFEAKVFRTLPMHSIELQTVHRQTDVKFIEILNRVRVGEINAYNDPNIHALNQRYNPNFKVNFYDGSINLLTRNADVDSFNQQGLQGLLGQMYTYQGVIEGEFNANNLPAPMTLELKVNAQVMFVRNKNESTDLVLEKDEQNSEGTWKGIVGDGWRNGTLGTVVHLEENGIVVKIQEGGRERLVVVQKEVWENVRYELRHEENQGGQEKKTTKVVPVILGSYTQYPLKLAYAITIHKSQGMTFQKVNIDVSTAFAEGQVYVALSRARSIEGITLLNPVQPYRIKVNPRVVQFYKTISQK